MSEVKQGRSADYYEGAADGIKEYAEKRDGVMWVGTQGKTLAAALDEVEGIRRAVALVPEDAPPAKVDDGENTPIPQTPPKKDEEEDDDEDGNTAENATPRAPRRRR